MPDFLKKAAKRTAAICEDGEAGVAALFVRPRHGDDTKRLGAPGGALGKLRPLADDEGEGTDERAAMFARNAVLVLTEHRLLAFGHGSYTGRVKELVGELPLSAIAAMNLDAPPPGEKGMASLEVVFADGERVTVTPGSRRAAFVRAFEEMTQPA